MIKEILRTAYARAYVRIKAMNSDPTHFIIDIALPLLGLSAILLAYKALHAPQEFLAIAAIGGAMMAFWYNVLWSMASQFFWERETGNLPLYITSGAPMPGVLLGMALGGAFSMTLRAIGVLLLTSFLFGIKFYTAQIIPAFILFLLTLFALYALGMVFASSFLRFGRSVSKINELLGEPILFLSGVYFPVRVFPFAVQIIVSLIPLALGIEGMRQLMVYNTSPFNILWIYFTLIGLGILFFILAIRMIKYMEEKGKITGTLILRWE